MAYTNKDIAGLVTQLKGDFSNLYADDRMRSSIVQSRHGDLIAEELKKLAYPRIRPVVSRELEWASGKIMGILGSPEYEVHIEPHRDGDEKKADRLEIGDANLLLNIDKGGELSSYIHRHQATRPYAALWVAQNPYNLPKRRKKKDGAWDEGANDYNDRVDRWRRSYTALRVEGGDPQDCAFLEDGKLNITTAAREYEVPVLDFCEDYGEYDREEYASGEGDPGLMLKIWNEQFAEIRAGYGFDQNSDPFGSRQKLKISLVDNGREIYHCIVFGGENKARNKKGQFLGKYAFLGEFSDEGGPWKNPFGIPTLIIIPGVFDQSAILPEDRYKPLLLPLIQSRWNLDFTWSQWASKAAERPKYAAALPPQTQESLAQMDPAAMQQFLGQVSTLQENKVNYVLGELKNPDAEASFYEEKLYQEQRGEHFQYVPQSTYTGSESSQSTLRSTPTSSLLRQDELEAMDYDEAFKLKFNGMLKILKMHDHFWLSRKDEADAEDRTNYVTSTGNERRQGKVTPRGMKIEIPAEDYDFPFDRSINRIDNRSSSVLSRMAVVRERMTMPNGNVYITDEEVCTELGIPDATGYMKKVRIETRYKRVQEASDSLTMAAAMRQNALELGVDVTTYLVNQSAAPAPPLGSGGSSGSGYMMRPPATDHGAVSATAGV